ncbi:2'-5' RNA ligase family protein [Bacillus salacetis]|uniref:2'-5' RNA ligase family protein n=1 Tax=Bacillus salacetis TaxID=2315464 RepID=A0A3A1QXX9_9BACI|nr:2'-5' RNA ligase family protein [Bacillus salacetis]RIW32006.1 2'-5' RNA ligase family protein [Bacillus salacetis]
MEVEYFIGVVPPKDYLNTIETFQCKWIEQSGVEPHITLKAQGGLTADKGWIPKVEKVCGSFAPFHVSLEKPTYFGDNILFLQVKSTGLQKLHQQLVQEISPSEDLIKKYYELEAFIPHLTLGKEQYGGNISSGLAKKELKEMERLADKELAPYPEFEVNFVRIYELNTEKQRYERYSDIPLDS